MLGRNKITKIEGLSNLVKLDILDLHSNRIEVIENVRSLSNLRILNLEDNLIREIPTLIGLSNLMELNMRRNKVWAIHDNSTQLGRLSKITLTDNCIQLIQDIESIFKLTSLTELCLDQNKVALLPSFKTMVVSKCMSLKLLNGRRVLDETKRSAMKLAKREELKRREVERKADYIQEKEMYLEGIRASWESTMSGGIPPPSSSTFVLPMSTMPGRKTAYVELDNTTLRIFGNGSAALNRSESRGAKEIEFDYVDYNLILPFFKVVVKHFDNLTTLVFHHVGLDRLKQLLPLAELKNLDVLNIDDCNAITKLVIFRPFAIFLLSPSLLVLCDLKIDAMERKRAVDKYSN